MIAKRTKTVTLTFKRSALIYDIENYAFVEGDVMHSDNEHAKHQVFDIAQDGNVDRVTRMLNLAYSECVEIMYPYTKEPCNSEEEQNNELVEKEEYVNCLNALLENNGKKVRLPEKELQKRVDNVDNH